MSDLGSLGTFHHNTNHDGQGLVYIAITLIAKCSRIFLQILLFNTLGMASSPDRLVLRSRGSDPGGKYKRESHCILISVLLHDQEVSKVEIQKEDFHTPHNGPPRLHNPRHRPPNPRKSRSRRQNNRVRSSLQPVSPPLTTTDSSAISGTSTKLPKSTAATAPSAYQATKPHQTTCSSVSKRGSRTNSIPRCSISTTRSSRRVRSPLQARMGRVRM